MNNFMRYCILLGKYISPRQLNIYFYRSILLIKVLYLQHFYGILTKRKGVMKLAFTYKPLWKLLIDKEMNKKHLMAETNISKSTMDKMGRNENVSMEILDRLCSYFSCNISDIIEHIDEVEKQ